jgi:transmembrane sensor
MNNSVYSDDEKAMRIAYLIAGFVNKTLKPHEFAELDRWLEQSDENIILFEKLTDEDNIEAGLAEMRQTDVEAAYKRIQNKIVFKKEKKYIQLWTYAVAASLILILTAGYFLLWNDQVSAPLATEQPQPANDILPGTDKATLTLADGRTIVLEEQAIGNISLESGTNIIKKDSGQIAYNTNQGSQGEMVYNTLIIPKGGQYQITLSDGTKVWINAASILRYPVVFSGMERTIELTGEAYLEVVHDPQRPFHVKSANQDVTVIGTRFNISAYRDDALVKTTLLEGKIKLSTESNNIIVKPGQQYITDATGDIALNKKAHVETAVAWKNGVFSFKDEKIENILKQISRWYDAEIVYEGKVDHHFNGEISRKLPVSKVLNLLEKTGRVHFDIEGKKIKVRP